MKKKHVIILGGGISGLTARYLLTKQNPELSVTLLEKNSCLGGLIQTETQGFFFEKGPRTFKASRSPALLSLIDELGLTSECIFSDRSAARRFIWKEDRLHQVPSNPLSLISSSIGRKIIPSLLREWKRPYPWEGDETIYAFVKRRLGTYAAETFFDPMTLGIYAGDIHRLSIQACFPALKEMETKYGSLTCGFLKQKKKSKMKGLFTFKQGVQSLIDALVEQGRGDICMGSEASQITFRNHKVEVTSSQGNFQGSHLVCALSAPGAGRLLSPLHSSFQDFYQALEMVGLAVVNVGFKKSLLPHKGFGYLVPSSQNQNVLGVIYDSSIFPNQNQREEETRLTVMLGGAFHPRWAQISEKACKEEALRVIKKHLKIDRQPEFISVTRYPAALPQLTVGHGDRVKKLEARIQTGFPRLMLIGNYLHGVSIESCVCQLKKMRAKNNFDF